MSRDIDQRILPSGYSELGAMFPFGVSHIILTDWDLGTKWALTWNLVPATADGFGRISLTTDLTIARREGFIEYGINEGPLLQDGRYMLMLRNGHIGFVFNDFPIGEQAATSTKPYAKFQFQVPRLIYLVTTPINRIAFTPEFRS